MPGKTLPTARTGEAEAGPPASSAPTKPVPHPSPDLFVVHPSEGRPLPVIASLPHSGLFVPPDIDCLFTPEHRVWLRNTDWFLPEVYDFLPGLGVTTIAATHSRYVADLNHDPEDLVYGTFSRAVIARHTAQGTPIYTEPDRPRDFAAVVARYHAPFHAELRRLLDDKMRFFGRALLLDLHSFMGPGETDVCLGDRQGRTCRPATIDGLEHALRKQEFDVARNAPFPGGFIVRSCGIRPHCEALQIELRYTTYLDCTRIDKPEQPRLEPARIAAVQRKLRYAIEKGISGFLAE